MQTLELYFKKNKIRCRIQGQGNRLIIAFHGFSLDGGIFDALNGHLNPDFKLYAIDLPFHGKTKWSASSYSPTDIAEIVKQILFLEKKNRFEALGFSLGARLWFKLIDAFPGQIKKLHLLSPDGIQTRGLGLASKIPNGLIKRLEKVCHSPNRMIKLANQLLRLKIINRFDFKFVKHHLSNEENRKRVFGTWLSLKQFTINKEALKKSLKEANIPTTFIIGKRDPLVNLSAIKKFAHPLPNTEIFLMDKSHQLIDGTLGEWIY
ncbi:MAG: alpha/beta hydrolase [Bacteroidota bacterium]